MTAQLDLLLVQNDSDPNKEIAKIKVVEAGYLGGFALVDSTFNADDEPSNEFRHIFIFPNIEVAKGDHVWVHTGRNTTSKRSNVGNTTTHLLYWNSKEPVWNNKQGDLAVLIQFSVVDTAVVAPVKK